MRDWTNGGHIALHDAAEDANYTSWDLQDVYFATEGHHLFGINVTAGEGPATIQLMIDTDNGTTGLSTMLGGQASKCEFHKWFLT